MHSDEAALAEQASVTQMATGGADALKLSGMAGTTAASRYDQLPIDQATVLTQEIAPSRRDSLRRRLLAVADVLALVLAFGVVRLLDTPASSLSSRLVLLGALPFWIVLNKVLGLYDRDATLIHKSTLDEFPRLVESILLGTGAMFMLSPLLFGFDLHREQTLWFGVAASALMPALRVLARWLVHRICEAERTLIVGSGTVSELLRSKIAGHPEYAIELVGRVDEPCHEGADSEVLPLLGDVERFDEIVRETEIERVIIAFSSLSHEHMLDVVRAAKRRNLKITVVPRLFEAIGHAVELDQVEGMPLIGLRSLTRTHSSMLLKRGIDVFGATVGLLLLSPALLAIAAAIRLTSSGPALYLQRRVGRDNRSFKILKFRTMYSGADEAKQSLLEHNEAAGPMFKIAEDPRITRVGRFLRRTSIDELPQLWNVLRGEMSLVGPRPLIPAEDHQVIGWHRDRLALTPGLTGPWQVMGRTAIPFQEMVKLDYLYVAEWSLWNDIKLLLRTLPVVLGARGH